MALVLLLALATADREELSGPMPSCPTGDRSCKRRGGGGRRRHNVHSVAGLGKESRTLYYALPWALKDSVLSLFQFPSLSLNSFIFVYYFFRILAWRAFFPLSLNAYLMATI
jgi:hypothetical protein